VNLFANMLIYIFLEGLDVNLINIQTHHPLAYFASVWSFQEKNYDNMLSW
jgi:hypothetical protein